jgi:hypothetical protein
MVRAYRPALRRPSIENVLKVVFGYYLWGMYKHMLWSILPLGRRSMGKGLGMGKRKKIMVVISEDTLSASSYIE